MGITYFACAYPAELTELVVKRPEFALTANPVMEAWRREQPEGHILLDLDKTFHAFQFASAPDPISDFPGRPCFRMFEGQVTQGVSWDYGWDPWLRAITPDETVLIAEDLISVEVESVAQGEVAHYPHTSLEDARRTAQQVLHQAQVFTQRLAACGNGFAYMIG